MTFQKLYLIYILFADDTSIIITSRSPRQFKHNINKVFGNINDLLRINLISLNFDKILFIIHY